MTETRVDYRRRHPAKFSDSILPVIDSYLGDGDVVLDPFAGTGRIHELRPRIATYGIEIEPEWAALSPWTKTGDALNLPYRDHWFDAIATSPTYGNRMADHHNARDASERLTYTHRLGRPLMPTNSGSLAWGPKYRTFHEQAWREAVRVLRPGGRFVLNCGDHIRKDERQFVTAWHIRCLRDLGLTLVAFERVETPKMGFGANGDKRVAGEFVVVMNRQPYYAD